MALCWHQAGSQLQILPQPGALCRGAVQYAAPCERAAAAAGRASNRSPDLWEHVLQQQAPVRDAQLLHAREPVPGLLGCLLVQAGRQLPELVLGSLIAGQEPHKGGGGAL